MKSSATLFSVALALGAITFAPCASIQAEDQSRQEGTIEIKKCQTISQPGSYKLVNNLTFSGSGGSPPTCLTISANLVTIDLAGFSISGDGGEIAGIRASPALDRLTGIVVRNGSITGFRVQVDLASADNSVVEGLRVFGSSDGVGIQANGIVKGNIVDGHINGIGLFVGGTITGNYAANNSNGIDVNPGSTVIGNTALGNSVGILAFCPSNVTDNTAINNEVNLLLDGNGCNNTNNVAP